MFKHEIHVAVTKALIEAIKNRTPTAYDNEPSFEVIKKYYLADASRRLATPSTVEITLQQPCVFARTMIT